MSTTLEETATVVTLLANSLEDELNAIILESDLEVPRLLVLCSPDRTRGGYKFSVSIATGRDFSNFSTEELKTLFALVEWAQHWIAKRIG